jgi:ferredoxin
MGPAGEVCAVVKTLEFLSKVKICDRCWSCMIGATQVSELLRKLTRGEGVPDDFRLLGLLSSGMKETARCKGCKEAAGVLADLLASEEYAAHVESRRCPQRSCSGLTTYQVVAERCTMCGLCKQVCPEGAVSGEEYLPYLADNVPYTIRAEKCTKCGLCLPVCAESAIELV